MYYRKAVFAFALTAKRVTVARFHEYEISVRNFMAVAADVTACRRENS